MYLKLPKLQELVSRAKKVIVEKKMPKKIIINCYTICISYIS